jgi:hypothetical protein
MGITLPKGWRFVEYDEKTEQMIKPKKTPY